MQPLPLATEPGRSRAPAVARPTPVAVPPPVAEPPAQAAEARYWDEVIRRTCAAGPLDGWYRYMRRVYGDLARDWLGSGSSGRCLKTDLFEEAISPHHPLADLGAGGFGLDLSLGAAGRARGRARPGAPLSCVVGDLRAMPVRSGSLHGILSGSSLDHFQDPAQLRAGLAELARVLAPGGTLALTLDNPHNPVVWLRNHLPYRLLERLGFVPYFVGVTLGRAEAIRELEAAGLRVVETRAVAHAPRFVALGCARWAGRLGGRGAWLGRAFGACERLASWPTRWLTAYYLAFRAVKIDIGPA